MPSPQAAAAAAPPPPKGKWTTKAAELAVTAGADGSLVVSFPLYDNGVKQLTHRLTVTPDRAVEVLVTGEPGAVLTGFQAWSNL